MREPLETLHVGIDAGLRSVGLAAIIRDPEGWPLDVPYLISVKHDGGKDAMSSNQTYSVSRKKSAGINRRQWNRKAHRKAQRRKLRELLIQHGFPSIDTRALGTYDAWESRIRASAGFIIDEAQRKRDLAISLQHMERHRGWVNTWLPIESVINVQEPTEDLKAAVDRLRERALVDECTLDDVTFQCDLAKIGLNPTYRIRPRTRKLKKPVIDTTFHLLGRQRREDIAREWLHLCATQRIEVKLARQFAITAFQQERPHVPEELVGRDWIPGFADRPRAPLASMEHQEAKIRQSVANLGVRDSPRSRTIRRLSLDEQTVMVDTLSAVTERSKQPLWRDLAEALDIEPSLLVHTENDEQLTAKAPINLSITALHSLPASHPVRRAWKGSPPPERLELMSRLSEPGYVISDPAIRDKVDTLLSGLSVLELEKIESLKFPAGRSKHCREVLRILNAEMARSGDTYVIARNRIFNDGSSMVPARDSLEVTPSHPTLQRVVPPVRRFLKGVTKEYGQLSSVTIEHVRDALVGFDALREYRKTQGANRKARERAAAHLRDVTGDTEVRSGQIRRFQLVKRQHDTCLYCGTPITYENAEIDHIVPRSTGGSSRQANLAACCSQCNREKGKLPFSVYAATTDRPEVSLDGALQRVKEMNPEAGFPASKFAHVKREMTQRLRQRAEDPPLDERTLGSTAYAATDLRDRIHASFGDDVSVPAYRGMIVSAARKASGFDKMAPLRPGMHTKSRLDRGHHAIDAAVAAMINPSVATTLAQREELRSQEQLLGFPTGWRDFQGTTPTAIAKFDLWKQQMLELAKIIRKKIEVGELVVMQSPRYSASVSKLHEDTRKPLDTKSLGSAWSDSEIARVVDRAVYSQLGIEKVDLPEDPDRRLRLASGKWLAGSDPIYMFPPGQAARLALPQHSHAKLGGSIHHARFYRIPAGRKEKICMLRVWGADLVDLPKGIHEDLFNQPLDPLAPAVRRTHPALRRALEVGQAELVGWAVPRDEMRLEPSAWASEKSEIGTFMRIYPESSWEILGMEDDSRLNLRPLHLASEGLDESVDPIAFKIISTGARVAVSRLFALEGTRIIRRTGMGQIRETPGVLPSSWDLG